MTILIVLVCGIVFLLANPIAFFITLGIFGLFWYFLFSFLLAHWVILILTPCLVFTGLYAIEQISDRPKRLEAQRLQPVLTAQAAAQDAADRAANPDKYKVSVLDYDKINFLANAISYGESAALDLHEDAMEQRAEIWEASKMTIVRGGPGLFSATQGVVKEVVQHTAVGIGGFAVGVKLYNELNRRN